MKPRTAVRLVAAGLAAMSLAACASTATPAALPSPTPTGSASPEPDLGECAPAFLTTVTAGQLTVGIPVGSPAPFLSVERNSTDRIGLEADVVDAIAGELGLPKTAVFWQEVEVDPAAVVVRDSVDFVIGRLPIAPGQDAVAAFSAPYLDVRQVVVARTGSPAAAARSLAELRALRIAARAGTRSPMAAASALRPSEPVTELPSLAAGVEGLRRATVDALIVDAVDAGVIVAESEGELMIVGQLPAAVGDPVLGLAFAPGNPLRTCVDRAIADVVAAGVIEQGVGRWLGDGARRALADSSQM